MRYKKQVPEHHDIIKLTTPNPGYELMLGSIFIFDEFWNCWFLKQEYDDTNELYHMDDVTFLYNADLSDHGIWETINEHKLQEL